MHLGSRGSLPWLGWHHGSKCTSSSVLSRELCQRVLFLLESLAMPVVCLAGAGRAGRTLRSGFDGF